MTRRTLTLRHFMVLALFALAPAPAIAQTLQAPEGWIARPERFVEMPPGFHITAGRGVILYNPAATARGEFRVESEGFLFDPLGADGTYGLILGGRELESDAQRYIAFEIGSDGNFSVRRQADFVSTQLAGGVHQAIHRWTGADVTVKNVLSVDAGAAIVRFRVNDNTVAELARTAVDPDGVIGFRIDSGLNTHITTLDITTDAGRTEWAPKPPEE